jgi:hypothetical protein
MKDDLLQQISPAHPKVVMGKFWFSFNFYFEDYLKLSVIITVIAYWRMTG